MSGVKTTAAAKILKLTPKTVREWIRKGAPCVRLGSVGRNHGSLVDIDALQRWRADQVAPGLTVKSHQLQLDQLAESLWRVLRNDQAAAKVGIFERQAAGLLLLTYERLAKDLTREPVDLETLPARMKQICSNYLD